MAISTPLSVSPHHFEVVLSDLIHRTIGVSLINKSEVLQLYRFYTDQPPGVSSSLGIPETADIRSKESQSIIVFFESVKGEVNISGDCQISRLTGFIVSHPLNCDRHMGTELVTFDVIIPPGVSTKYNVRYIVL